MEAEEDAEPLGDGPDELAVGNRPADVLGDVHAEEERALLGATGAEAALFAGEGDEELVVAVGAADAGEAVLEVAALEEGGDGLVDGGAPVAEFRGVMLGVGGAEVVEVFANQAMEVGLKGLARAVDGGGGWVGEADHLAHRTHIRSANEPACGHFDPWTFAAGSLTDPTALQAGCLHNHVPCPRRPIKLVRRMRVSRGRRGHGTQGGERPPVRALAARSGGGDCTIRYNACMDNIIRVGIAGQGRSGFDIHARWLRQAPQQYKIVAVADQLEERRLQAAAELGCRVYNDYKELVADKEIDLFVNSLPSFLHPQATIDAIKAGHNVVSEKPFAIRVKDVDRMVDAAHKAGKLLAPFQNSRFTPIFIKLRQVIDSGVLGKIVHVRISCSSFGRRWDWQTKQQNWGGNLNNTGPHPMDQAIMLFGEGTPHVFARLSCHNPFGGDADDFAAVTLYGKEAPVVEVFVSSYLAYPQGDQYSVSGTFGGLAASGETVRWKYFRPEEAPEQKMMSGWSDNRQYCRETLPWREETWTAPKEKEGMASFDVLSREFYNNIHDVLTKGAPLVVTPQQVRRQIAAIEECHRQNKLARKG